MLGNQLESDGSDNDDEEDIWMTNAGGSGSGNGKIEDRWNDGGVYSICSRWRWSMRRWSGSGSGKWEGSGVPESPESPESA